MPIAWPLLQAIQRHTLLGVMSIEHPHDFRRHVLGEKGTTTARDAFLDCGLVVRALARADFPASGSPDLLDDRQRHLPKMIHGPGFLRVGFIYRAPILQRVLLLLNR